MNHRLFTTIVHLRRYLRLVQGEYFVRKNVVGCIVFINMFMIGLETDGVDWPIWGVAEVLFVLFYCPLSAQTLAVHHASLPTKAQKHSQTHEQNTGHTKTVRDFESDVFASFFASEHLGSAPDLHYNKIISMDTCVTHD